MTYKKYRMSNVHKTWHYFVHVCGEKYQEIVKHTLVKRYRKSGQKHHFCDDTLPFCDDTLRSIFGEGAMHRC